MTAASAAAVEAVQKELGCQRRLAEAKHPDVERWDCWRHAEDWTDRGCPVAVLVADAVVEAQG